MTKITKEGLNENLEALTKFVYGKHHADWLEYCRTQRGNKQDIEELSMLIRSITAPNPWRMIISTKQIEDLVTIIVDKDIQVKAVLEEIKAKLKENETLVSGDS